MEWVRGAKIGEGSFGTVNLAKPTSKDPDFAQLWAVKSCSASTSGSLLNEKRILDELKDCHEIIQCYGDCYTYEDNEKLYNVFLEYASQGSLYRKIKNSDGVVQLPEIDVRRYVKGILRGLDYIHKNGFVHCDIKLQNILLNQDGEIKIADFGLAKKIGGKSGCELTGTPMYMSPEMVTGGDQGSAADIWAFGCLVVEMFTGAPVWKCSALPELLFRIGGHDSEMPNLPEDLSVEGKDFLRKCFIRIPERRWTAEMLLNHPFLAYDDGDHNNGCGGFASASSPTSVFDFSEWVPQSSPSSFPKRLENWGSSYGSRSGSPADRLQRLCNHQQQCNWSVDDEDWITVR